MFVFYAGSSQRNMKNTRFENRSAENMKKQQENIGKGSLALLHRELSIHRNSFDSLHQKEAASSGNESEEDQ